MNEALLEVVIESEVYNSLSSFQKLKGPGPDGLTVKFFLGFYDLLKECLLKVGQES